MKFKFVFVSKDSEFRMPREKMDALDRASALYFPNNAEPLSKVYNRALDEDKDSDFILLVHADVSFDPAGVMDQLESVSGKYDLLGMCGCAKKLGRKKGIHIYQCVRDGLIRRFGEEWYNELEICANEMKKIGMI